MCTDKKEYQFGEPIHVTFTIKNISADSGQQYFGPIEFGSGAGPAMDICDPWEHTCWSDGQTLTENDKHFVLKLGESRTLTWTWPTMSEHLDYINEYIIDDYHDSGDCFTNALSGCHARTTELECIMSGPWIVYGECPRWGP